MLKRVGKIILVTPLVISVLFMCLFIAVPLVNNVQLHKFTKQFSAHQLPAETKVLETKSVVGKLNGNGNGLDFFAAVLVKSSLSVDKLTHYYEQEEFKNAKRSGNYPVVTEVLPVTGDSVDSEHLEHRRLVYQSLSQLKDYSGYYFVVLYDGGYDSGFDLRGH